jgi:hypothetical protein
VRPEGLDKLKKKKRKFSDILTLTNDHPSLSTTFIMSIATPLPCILTPPAGEVVNEVLWHLLQE